MITTLHRTGCWDGHDGQWTTNQVLSNIYRSCVLSIDVLCVHFVRREIKHFRLCLTLIRQWRWSGAVQWCHAAYSVQPSCRNFAEISYVKTPDIQYFTVYLHPPYNTRTGEQHSKWILTKHHNSSVIQMYTATPIVYRYLHSYTYRYLQGVCINCHQ